MPTYLYETVSDDCCAKPTYYEVEQPADAAPLEVHPETGETIKRVTLANQEVVRESASDDCCSDSGCC